MSTFFEYAPCICFSTTDEGLLLEVNNFLCANLGYERSELQGKKIDVLLTISSRIFQQTHFFPLLKLHGHAEEIYITLQKSNREHVPVLINALRTEINGEPVNLYTGIIVYNRKKFEDELVTAKKSAESALKESTALNEAKFELQKRIEALDEQMQLVKKQHHELAQFNWAVTHNLIEPLRKMQMFTELLHQKNESAELHKFINKITLATEQMRQIVSDLQQYIWLHQTPVNRKSVDINKLIDKVAEKLSAEFRDIEMHLEKNTLPEIEGDEKQLELLFYHVLSNTIRFRKHKVMVFVSVSATELKLNKFRHLEDQYKYADFCRITVKDQGIGFDGNYKDRAFELFGRLHEESGRGVGLALCKKIVDNHLGNIRIDSSEGNGAILTIELPMNPLILPS